MPRLNNFWVGPSRHQRWRKPLRTNWHVALDDLASEQLHKKQVHIQRGHQNAIRERHGQVEPTSSGNASPIRV
jgi:hypothetical protein